MRFRRNKQFITLSVIDTTLVVNVVFLILILLLSMKLPIGETLHVAGGAIGMPAAGSTTIVVLPESVVIDGKQANDQSLKGLPRNRDFIIQASRVIPYSKVLSVLDAMRASGHTRLSLATKPLNN
jgi:biopolymer transport protein ExbD